MCVGEGGGGRGGGGGQGGGEGMCCQGNWQEAGSCADFVHLSNRCRYCLSVSVT